ncbi:Type IV secretory pathway%2C VirD4 components [uncultured Clostridium sp.]|nr:Type IV secretory pathway%2C VirD4 components [uncultured Clostridium sp.]
MKPEIKKLLILNLPYLLFVWLFDKVGAAVRLSPGADASAKLLHLGDGFTAAFSSIAPSFHPADLALGIAGAVIVRLIIYTKGKNAKKYRRGTEYGSARWGGADDIKPYTDPVFENNIPLTQTERLTMNSRPKQPKYARNKNILVIGGSGSGKTRFFVKPSLMQCTSKDFPTSYIHPLTFYCSPFFLDMSTQFNQLAKIIHMYMLTISRFFCIVLLKGGNVYVT